jgi:hypothetical protein
MPGVEHVVARFELTAVGTIGARRLETPAGVERSECDRVSGVDLEDGLEVAREVTVQRPPLERNLVGRPPPGQNSSVFRTAAATRSTDGM